MWPPEKRAQAFGLLGAAPMGGFILGPVIGASWARSARALFTLPPAARRPFDRTSANPFGALRAVGRLQGVAPLLLVLALLELAYISYVAIWVFWSRAAFGWTPMLTGVSLAAYGAGAIWAQAHGIRIYLRLLGERGTILFSLAFPVVVFVVFARLPHGPLGGWIVLLLCPVSALGEVAMPALQGRISRLVPADAQGEAQGVVASVRSAAQILGPLLMTGLFAWGEGVGRWALLGAPYLLGAALALASVALFQRSRAPETAPATS